MQEVSKLGREFEMIGFIVETISKAFLSICSCAIFS